MQKEQSYHDKNLPIQEEKMDDYMLFSKWQKHWSLRTQLDLYNTIALNINRDEFFYTRRAGVMMLF